MKPEHAEFAVLFVCLGNICRSPTAEAAMRRRLADAGLAERVAVDSAGTGPWHVGEPPDARAQVAAAARGYDLHGLAARQVTVSDLARFDEVLAMDHDNLAALHALNGDRAVPDERIRLLGDLSPRYAGQPVGDPYYGGADGFRRVLDMIETCVDTLVDDIAHRLPQL